MLLKVISTLDISESLRQGIVGITMAVSVMLIIATCVAYVLSLLILVCVDYCRNSVRKIRNKTSNTPSQIKPEQPVASTDTSSASQSNPINSLNNGNERISLQPRSLSQRPVRRIVAGGSSNALIRNKNKRGAVAQPEHI